MQDGLLEAWLWRWLSLARNTRSRAQGQEQQKRADMHKIIMYDQTNAGAMATKSRDSAWQAQNQYSRRRTRCIKIELIAQE
jgi:hypothetical protein